MTYVITILDGRKIVKRFKYQDYETAMDALDELEAKYGNMYSIDYKRI
jgi:pterin-4a-carbinolamine dehydratase